MAKRKKSAKRSERSVIKSFAQHQTYKILETIFTRVARTGKPFEGVIEIPADSISTIEGQDEVCLKIHLTVRYDGRIKDGHSNAGSDTNKGSH